MLEEDFFSILLLRHLHVGGQYSRTLQTGFPLFKTVNITMQTQRNTLLQTAQFGQAT